MEAKARWLSVSRAVSCGERMLTSVELTAKRVATNVGIVHEQGHPEPWFIAMSDVPTTHKTFDYGLRWGIEAMFSDFKSRGFGLENSHLQRVDRMNRLMLMMTLTHFTGPFRRGCGPPCTPQSPPKKRPRQSSQENRAQPGLILQARPTPHSNLSAKPLHFTQAMVGLEKLMDGKVS